MGTTNGQRFYDPTYQWRIGTRANHHESAFGCEPTLNRPTEHPQSKICSMPVTDTIGTILVSSSQ
uniref:Uncharacterized protein n=1 Tax=Anopheles minimus TaxID=112268 RepID=A0A182W446_9DIPT